MSNKFIRYIASHDTIMYDEEIVKNLKRIKELLLDEKTITRFDHVRGNVENKEIMSETIDKAINIINLQKNI